VSWRGAALNLTGLAILVASAVLAAAPALGAPWDGREALILVWGMVAYAATVAAGVKPQPQPARAQPQASAGPVPGVTAAGDFNRPTEEALKNIHNPSALGRSKLAELLPATLAAMRGPALSGHAAATPLEQAQLLRQVLESSMEALKKAAGPDLPPEGKALQYLILHEEYVLGRPNTSIMTRHSISESTFHRYRREAIHAIAAELAAQEALLARPASQPN
jgi:hypothetical protein